MLMLLLLLPATAHSLSTPRNRANQNQVNSQGTAATWCPQGGWAGLRFALCKNPLFGCASVEQAVEREPLPPHASKKRTHGCAAPLHHAVPWLNEQPTGHPGSW